MNRLFPLALVASLAAVGCGDPLAPSDLVGNTWQLISLQDGTATPVTVADPSRYTRRFGNDDRVAVQSDCNSCGGEYSLNGGMLRIGPLACTRAFCGEASLDPSYPAALDKARAASLNEQAELSIHGDGVTLRFRK